MEYALIQDGSAIVRRQEFDEPPPALAPEKGLAWHAVPERTEAKAGFILGGLILASGSLTWEQVPEPEPGLPPVPTSVTNAQARAALLDAGLFDAVDAALKEQGGVALQFWEYANTVNRNGQLVTGLGASLGLTEAQIDDLFRTAAAIEV